MIQKPQRPGDCKSSIPQFDSESRLHSPHRGNGVCRSVENFCEENKKSFVKHPNNWIYESMDVPVTVSDHGSYCSLKFSYKEYSHTHRLYVELAQLSGADIEAVVTKFIKEVDGIVDLTTLLDFYLEYGTGSLATRKKNVSHIKDFCKRDDISLDSDIKILAQVDELGRTLPERWEALFDLPHKLRQVRSIFGRKNIALYKREGWDTTVFGNFVVFVPETTVSQPFSTSDAEVDHIISFFNKARFEHPVFYDIYLLAFGCGLRKSEIYQITYENFTTFNNQHFLLLPFATKRTKLKQLNGYVEKVGISKQVYDHFTSRQRIGDVINGGERLHKRFVKFLKEQVGIDENKACHRLRKILGARLATTAGIFHASKTLRNSVAVCEKYYSDLTAHANELAV